MPLSINVKLFSKTNNPLGNVMTVETQTQSVFKSWGILAIKSLLGVVLLAVIAFFAGPTNEFGSDTPTSRIAPTQNLAALDDWIAQSEAKFSDIKPGTAKGIVWANPSHQKTPWAVVYIHGFSASRMETAPVADLVAKKLGANLFYTRLSGHGLPGTALGQVSVQDWLADTVEAVRIGQNLGEKILVISCSTGSTLSTWLETSPYANSVQAHVFISPNFGLKDKRSELLNGHWGKQIAMAITGTELKFPEVSVQESSAWTKSYPTSALFPMMALVKKVRESDARQFMTPLLVLYSADDQTVDPLETQKVFERIGSPNKKLELVSYSRSEGQHVLAGDIRDPQSVQPMVSSIVNWLATTGLEQTQ
jgi:esterase/lipase